MLGVKHVSCCHRWLCRTNLVTDPSILSAGNPMSQSGYYLRTMSDYYSYFPDRNVLKAFTLSRLSNHSAIPEKSAAN
jgi:hypothetical protein